MKESNSTPEHKLTHTGLETHWISAEHPAQSAYQTFILCWALLSTLKEHSRIETEKQSFKCLLMTVKTARVQKNITVRKHGREK